MKKSAVCGLLVAVATSAKLPAFAAAQEYSYLA